VQGWVAREADAENNKAPASKLPTGTSVGKTLELGIYLVVG
jgi:hypothetical protein